MHAHTIELMRDASQVSHYFWKVRPLLHLSPVKALHSRTAKPKILVHTKYCVLANLVVVLGLSVQLFCIRSATFKYK